MLLVAEYRAGGAVIWRVSGVIEFITEFSLESSLDLNFAIT